jgi:hypothetical protein
MKLSEYIEKLQEVLKEHGDQVVIYSADDEGNHYDEVHYGPSAGSYNIDENEWTGIDDFKEHEDWLNEDEDEEDHIKLTVNSVCIN